MSKGSCHLDTWTCAVSGCCDKLNALSITLVRGIREQLPPKAKVGRQRGAG